MKYFFIVFILFVIGSVSGQNLKYGKVSNGDFKNNTRPQDSSVSAEILYKHEDISFKFIENEGFQQVRKIHERIIIYNKDGFDWATKKIRLYNRNNIKSENVKMLKGFTYNIVNDKIDKTKLSKSGVFKEEMNKYWAVKSFTMPNIKEGCIIEYSYEIQSPYLQIDDIDFQSTIPIKKLDFKVKMPEYYRYSKILNPRAVFIPEIKESRQSRTIRSTGKSRSGYMVTTTKYETQEFDFLENIYEVNLTDIPQLIAEPFVDNIDNYKSKLILELEAINYPDEVMKSFSSSWSTIVKNIYNNEDFGGELKKSSYYKDELQGLISEEDELVLKAYKIFNYIKSKVKWNGFVGYTVDNGVRKAFKEGTGNVADINLMLISMLRSANINANPVLISTKGNGIPLAPTRTGFNYVICMVETDKGSFLLDASDVNSTFNVLPDYILNWQGRVVRKDGSSNWTTLQSKKASSEIATLDIVISPNLEIEGKFGSRFTDYLAKKNRDDFRGLNNEDLLKQIEQNKGDIIIEELKVKNEHECNKPYGLTFNYKLNSEIDEVGDNLYFDPLLFLSIKENPYKLDKRNYPINLDFPTSKKHIINIKLPEGYSVVTLPKSVIYQLSEKKGEFKYRIKQQGNILLITVDLKLNTSFILTKDYEDFKMFYEAVIKKLAEQIVLTKT